MSLMSSFYVGVSGLSVSQASVNTTSHNMANLDTQGYVRQQVLTKDSVYNNIGVTAINTMQVGLGTNMATIRQVRDVFLDKAYRLEVGRLSFYEAQSESVGEVEGLFGELEGEAFQDNLNDFWVSLQELAKEPDNIVKRTALIEVADTLVIRSSELSEQLNKYQVSLNEKITKKVDRINEIGEQIKAINEKIAKSECGEEQANDYRDTRNKLLDELGGLASITYKEDMNGRVSVSLEGVQFVTEQKVYHLDTVPLNDKTDMLNVVWTGNNCGEVFDFDIECSTAKNTDVGSLKGILVARGNLVANYTNIPKREQYNNDADYANAVKDYNKTIDSSIITSIQAEFDQLVHNIVTMVNDILSPNDTVQNVMSNLGVTTSAQDKIAYETNVKTVDGQKIKDKIEISNTGKTTTRYKYDETVAGEDKWVVDSSVAVIHEPDVTTSSVLGNMQIWDEYNSPIGMDENKTPREELFSRKNTERYTKATIAYEDNGVEKTKDIWIYNEENPEDAYTLYTLGEIEINDVIKKDPSVLALTGSPYLGLTGAYDLATAKSLLEGWTNSAITLNPNTFVPSNFNEYYIAMIEQIANKGNIYEGVVKNENDLTESINDQRQQTMGVSSDDELTNLIMYQHAYNASSRYITAVDEMLEHLIAKLG